MGILQVLVTDTQPWYSVFFKTSCFSLPKTISDSDRRILTNLCFFRGNYVAIVIAFFLFNLIMNLRLLLVMIFASSVYYVISLRKSYNFQGMVIKRTQCILAFAILVILLCYFAGMRMVFVYTSETSLLCVLSHAVIYDKELLRGIKKESMIENQSEIREGKLSDEELDLV
ncbi:PRA1 family protein [Trichonephila clavipes]|nr:PRA1 family protein [Trichonephila clavipes]